MRTAFLLTALILGCVSPAAASPMPPSTPAYLGPPAPVFPQRADRAFFRLRSEIVELRRIGMEMRAGDGGRLTREHRDDLQARIDAAYQRYRDSQR
jgi:hypothetical protein